MDWEGARQLGGQVYRSGPPSDAVREQLIAAGVTGVEAPDEGSDGPAYYGEALRRSPGPVTSVFARIADAEPGEVLVFGDRTSMIAAMLQTLAGTPVADILDDYELDLRAANETAPEPLNEGALDLYCADACLAMVAFLGSTDVAGYLTASGLTFEQLDRLRERLTG
ncbi:tyrosine-protein phosphatase [Kribbella monticola]|uniref:tyrosine-protein phosphatase n=1 Tax=Kribbella monticola TaxID=2185285 RepID=UPI0013005672|nr:tyrosine-protein phosphatase [Kribbella monticola]